MNQITNVLITSVGRRIELVNEFKGIAGLQVFMADASPSVSAACRMFENYVHTPLITSHEYKQFLLNFCITNQIRLVIPTLDTELSHFSRWRSKFLEHGINLIVSDSSFVAECEDKRKTADLFAKYNIPSPSIYNDYASMQVPAVVKPVKGSNSIGMKIIKSKHELPDNFFEGNTDLVMEYVGIPFEEFTCDAYYNKNSELRCLVPRQRLKVRGGEVQTAVTRKHFVYDFLSNKLSMMLGARGCITIQVFGNPITEEVFGLEINPRFGGGYPLAAEAGARYGEWLIREYIHDEDIRFFESWKKDRLMLRFDKGVYCDWKDDLCF